MKVNPTEGSNIPDEFVITENFLFFLLFFSFLFFLSLFVFCYLFFSSLFFCQKFGLFLVLSFGPFYLLEILKIIACANHVIFFGKKNAA